MTNVDIKLVGRPTVASEFSELWAGTAVVGDDTVTVTPVVPPAAAGQELAVEVSSTGLSVNFAGFAMVPPAPDADPAPPPSFERVTSVYATHGGKAQRAPFKGSILALSLIGTPKPV